MVRIVTELKKCKKYKLTILLIHPPSQKSISYFVIPTIGIRAKSLGKEA